MLLSSLVFWKATGGKGEYMVVNLVNGGNALAKITPWTMKFVEAYKKKWGLEPEGYGTSSSYMAVYQLKDAIEKAKPLIRMPSLQHWKTRI